MNKCLLDEIIWLDNLINENGLTWDIIEEDTTLYNSCSKEEKEWVDNYFWRKYQ